MIPSLRSLCVLCASAVNSSMVLLALLSFQLRPFSVKEFLATYLEGVINFDPRFIGLLAKPLSKEREFKPETS